MIRDILNWTLFTTLAIQPNPIRCHSSTTTETWNFWNYVIWMDGWIDVREFVVYIFSIRGCMFYKKICVENKFLVCLFVRLKLNNAWICQTCFNLLLVCEEKKNERNQRMYTRTKTKIPSTHPIQCHFI